ncbi:MAG: DUF2779 domain-containing protein [Candidatus Woesearchaeota archaeon]|jgi:hypothetical protein|nr:hypothetical protein [Candidatus Woesearchaeota archaeon]MDP6648363.1 DUF2779 domain-containing protein [Candidatus Woesearchaeota archaeon]|tara:strand:- start:1477 stop:2946 length:1470 start_codon:yes stop_codon:yes gene_type:complete
MSTFLSKSKYLLGLQCPKYLWIAIHEKEKIPEVDQATQHRFDQGHLVGELAKKWFPKGIDIDQEDFKKNIEETKELISKRKILFEAGILADNIYSRADVLKPVGKDEWDIIEVKSSTEVKDVNIHDVSFQKHCYEKFGLKIRKCFLMFINNKYVRKGDVDPKELFKIEDITLQVDEVSEGIKERIEDMFKIIGMKKCPDVKLTKDCFKPYPCPIEECWSFLPKNNVFSLYRGGKKGFELYDDGIYSIKDIPLDFKLTSNQQIQKDCTISKKAYVDKEKIKSFLDTLKFPLYFLDFETYCTAIPLYDNLSPYQQIPFQFSLHILEDINSKPKHHSFLAEGDKDPRMDFLVSLKKVIGKKGDILVYNKAFENRIMNELSRAFPKNNWIESVTDRFVDLLIPFRKFYYYNSKQEGSASIKDVLPALTGKSYVDLEIAGGESASLQYLYITHGATDGTMATEKETAEIRKNLEKYCKLDTEGMIWIVEKLRGL